jgi:hypothetical protein
MPDGAPDGFGHPLAEGLLVAAALGHPLVHLCPRRGRNFTDAREALADAMHAEQGRPCLLVDGLTGAPLLRTLTEDGARVQPLFPDDADPELVAAAPRLVDGVSPEQVLSLFARFWGRGIASVAMSDVGGDDLVAHLARTLYAELPGGDLCILRFHDPRVLARLKDILEPNQLGTLFGEAISAFLFEDAAGRVACLLPRNADDDA